MFAFAPSVEEVKQPLLSSEDRLQRVEIIEASTQQWTCEPEFRAMMAM